MRHQLKKLKYWITGFYHRGTEAQRIKGQKDSFRVVFDGIIVLFHIINSKIINSKKLCASVPLWFKFSYPIFTFKYQCRAILSLIGFNNPRPGYFVSRTGYLVLFFLFGNDNCRK